MAAPDRAAAAPPSISVVIVNWNARDDLAACLRSVRAQREPADQLVVVDNGSEDGSSELVAREFSEVALVATGENLGFAEGCNRGLAVATGDWVAILNNDAEADPGWIAALRAAIRAGSPRLGALQSRIVFKQRRDHTNSTGLLLLADGRARDRDFDALMRPDDAEEPIFCATAAAALYRREMLEQVRLPSGYFDRGFFMYMEDLDLGWRCRLAGWECRYVPASVVYHAFQASSSRRGSFFVERHCKTNRVRALLKNASLPFILASLPRTGLDLAELALRGGPALLPDLLAAARGALAQRALVGRMAREDRRAVERRWAVRRRDV